MSENENLPVVGDFNTGNDENRVIKGTVSRCVDGHWSARDGTVLDPNTKYLVLATTEVLQCWKDGMPIDTIVQRTGEKLPDVAELNKQIPQEEWEEGIDGQPRPPWVHQYVVYLLNPVDAAMFTFINSTTGARIAVERLCEKVTCMRLLRGDRVVPMVKLDSRPMVTKYGTKQRPEFTIVDWRDLSGGSLQHESARQIEHQPAEVGKPVAPVTRKEILNDEIPW